MGYIFNNRDLISVPGPAPSGEALESFPAPPGGPDEKGAGAPSVCVRPCWEARSGDGPSFTPQEEVVRVRLGATPGTHPRGRHTSPPCGERYVEARDPPPPAAAGGSCHSSPGGFLRRTRLLIWLMDFYVIELDDIGRCLRAADRFGLRLSYAHLPSVPLATLAPTLFLGRFGHVRCAPGGLVAAASLIPTHRRSSRGCLRCA